MKTQILDKEISSVEELEQYINETKAFEFLIIDQDKFKNASDFEGEIIDLASRKNIIIGF